MCATRRTTCLLVLVPALAALAACDTIGNPIDAMSAKRPSPDEFQVIARKELRRPPGLGTSTLPEPRPGAPSPLEPDPRGDAVAALTGNRVAASAPLASSISRGEAALLAAADAQSANPDIRTQIIAENVAYEESKPYEPPTIFELFAGEREYDPEDVVDAPAEALRLSEAGVPTPVDGRALERQAALEAEAAAEAQAVAEPEPVLPREPRFRPDIPLQ